MLNGHAGLLEMAIRLERPGGEAPITAAYNLVQARRHEREIKVQRYEPRPAA